MAILNKSLLWWTLAAVIVLLAACQGSNPSLSSPRPRSREAAGEAAALPPKADLSSRESIDTDGGSVEYRNCRLTIPRGAVPEPLFIEIAIPDEQPETVLPESAYQINPDGFELKHDALLEIGYYDEDIPQGKDETDLVIVHSVSGVWVELSNSQVKAHANVVEAPVRYLGLYALRIAEADPRRVNTPPVAQFEFSEQPYAGMLGPSIEEAQKETQPKEETAGGTGEAGGAEGAAGEAGKNGAQGPEAGPQGPNAGEGGGEVAPPPPEGPEPEAPPPLGKATVTERRMVAGPDDAGTDAGSKDRDADQESAGGNVAEASAPAPTAAEDEGPVSAETPRVTVYFDASSSYDPDGKVVQYDWDFDSDGVFDYTSHSSPYAQHDFKVNGDYSVALKVSDNGRYAQAGYGTEVVRVRNPKAVPAELNAKIAAYPASGPSPHTVHFAATTTGGTPPYTYSWTFSDGSQSTKANPFTTYPEPGNHVVKYEVTDIDGTSLTGSLYVQSLDVSAPRTPQPRSELSITPTSDRGQAPFMGKFKLRTERATEPVTYRISFGDGSDEEDLVTTDTTFQHVFTNAGFYLIKVIATDADLRTASTFATVNAISPAGARDFTLSHVGAGGDPFSFGHDMHIAVDYTEASDRTVRFSAQQTPRDPNSLSYQWDFGDGTFSTDKGPVHTFARDGVYEVRLTADDGVERWRHRIWLPVSADKPAVAIERPAYSEGPAPLGIMFEAIVTRGEEPLRYDWNFDPARRSEPGVYYEFQMPGDYEVNLTVKDKWDQPIVAQPVKVKVRPGPVEYRQPLAVIQPVAGSTRAVVLDYTAANPLPLSNPNVEGPVDLIALSTNGEYAGIVGEEGLLVKRVSTAEPVLSFLPAAGVISALHVLDSGAACATVQTSSGRKTYLLRNREAPAFIADGTVATASGDGGVLILRSSEKEGAVDYTLFTADPTIPRFSDPQPLGQYYGVALPRDGRDLFFIDSKSRLVHRTLATGEDDYLSGGGDLKSGLTVSADGSAVAFVSQLKGDKEVIYGRYGVDGVFGLASVTEPTGFFSSQLALSADGDFLLAYGSRTELARLEGRDVEPVAADNEGQGAAEAGKQGEAAAGKEGAGEEVVAEEGVVTGLDAEDVSSDEELMPVPPRRRERFGVIRFNLSGDPDNWNLSTTNPRFVVECSAQFANAGPF